MNLHDVDPDLMNALLDEMTSEEARAEAALIEEECLRAQYRQDRLDRLYMAIHLAEQEAPYLPEDDGRSFMSAFYRTTEIMLGR
jgi:hypothetical protein